MSYAAVLMLIAPIAISCASASSQDNQRPTPRETAPTPQPADDTARTPQGPTMPAYFIASYDVSDADEYAKYNPGAVPMIMQTLAKHSGKVLVAGPGATWFEGARKALVLIEFPTLDSANAWRADPDYAEALQIRLASTSNRLEVIAPRFQPPSQ